VPELLKTLRDCQISCLDMAASCRRGRILRDGLRVVISGRPNVGKSSLFNLLVASNRSIVSPMPGTTRDTIEAWISIAGHGVRLVDTAGLRASDCPIESEGVRRSLAEMESSDLVVYVLDALAPSHNDDLLFLTSADPQRTLVVINKSDLHPLPALPLVIQRFRSLRISCSQITNIEHVADCIIHILAPATMCHESCEPAVSERHRLLLDEASESIHTAMQILDSRPDDGPALACPSLRNAADSLGAISGRTYTDDLLNQIFATFCIGK
jgi:tRNA modification GTPase